MRREESAVALSPCRVRTPLVAWGTEEAMNMTVLFAGACAAATLTVLAAPQAQALDVMSGAGAARLDDGMIAKAFVARRGGGAYHGGVYHGPRGGTYYHGGGVYRGGAYRGGVYRGGVYRGGVYRGYGYHPGYGGWARPGWYGWPAGGAIAAGAAIGVIGAAAAASYAGAPPAPGLCWYYTTPARTQGFWDACQ